MDKSVNWLVAMSENPFFDTFNAKHKTDEEIASSFVPPPNALERLVTRDHTVLSGPRGSGKTTLLKMLTLPALNNWHDGDSEKIKNGIDFVSVFVAADRSWHGQLKRLPRQIADVETANLLGMSAFTTHIFKAIMNSFIDWQNLRRGDEKFFTALVPRLDFEAEQDICHDVAILWQLTPRAFTFLEMRTALSHRLAQIGLLRNQLKFGNHALSFEHNTFLYLDYREGMKGAASAHNQRSGLGSRRWSFLFDEMEVAPSFVQESLFADLRGGVDETKYNYKLALAPFNKNFRSTFDEQGPSASHDYSHIDLTFARKESGYEFSRRLCGLLLSQAGVEGDVERLLGTSYFAFVDEGESESDTGTKYGTEKALGRVFKALREKDSSFRAYLEKKAINLDNIEILDDNARARTLRKVRNIVVIREYFSRPSSSGLQAEKLESRSRKSYTLYSGSPSMLALTEGNPRSLINLFSSLIAEYKNNSGIRKVSERRQAEEIQRSLRVMRSLLKTIPYKFRGSAGRGLLPFLDTIGAALHARLVSTKFSDQPPLSFRVDRGTGAEDLFAIGKALNLGALVYVPDEDSEDILSSVVGKRFRLNYLLAAHYKLPLSLDREINLSALLAQRPRHSQMQMDLTDDD